MKELILRILFYSPPILWIITFTPHVVQKLYVDLEFAPILVIASAIAFALVLFIGLIVSIIGAIESLISLIME